MREAGDLGDLERGGRGGRGRFLLDVPKDSLFVDEGVYTKNRNFRTLLSSKFGKKPAAILKPSAIENNAVTSVTKLRSIFFKVTTSMFGLALRNSKQVFIAKRKPVLFRKSKFKSRRKTPTRASRIVSRMYLVRSKAAKIGIEVVVGKNVWIDKCICALAQESHNTLQFTRFNSCVASEITAFPKDRHIFTSFFMNGGALIIWLN